MIHSGHDVTTVTESSVLTYRSCKTSVFRPDRQPFVVNDDATLREGSSYTPHLSESHSGKNVVARCCPDGEPTLREPVLNHFTISANMTI